MEKTAQHTAGNVTAQMAVLNRYSLSLEDMDSLYEENRCELEAEGWEELTPEALDDFLSAVLRTTGQKQSQPSTPLVSVVRNRLPVQHPSVKSDTSRIDEANEADEQPGFSLQSVSDKTSDAASGTASATSKTREEDAGSVPLLLRMRALVSEVRGAAASMFCPPAAQVAGRESRLPPLEKETIIRYDGALLDPVSVSASARIKKALRTRLPLAVRIQGIESTASGTDRVAVGFEDDWKIVIPSDEFMEWGAEVRPDRKDMQMSRRLGMRTYVTVLAVDETHRVAAASRLQAAQTIRQACGFSRLSDGRYRVQEGAVVQCMVCCRLKEGLVVETLGTETYLEGDFPDAAPGDALEARIVRIQRNSKRGSLSLGLRPVHTVRPLPLRRGTRVHGVVETVDEEGCFVRCGSALVRCRWLHPKTLEQTAPGLHKMLFDAEEMLDWRDVEAARNILQEANAQARCYDRVLIKIVKEGQQPEGVLTEVLG